MVPDRCETMAKVLFFGDELHLDANCLADAWEWRTATWADWPGAEIVDQQLDALLLDMTSPGAPGLEAPAELLAQHPDLATLLVIDLNRSDLERFPHVLQASRIDFARAPMDMNEVRIRIRRLMSRRMPVVAQKVSLRPARPERLPQSRATASAPPVPAIRHLVPDLRDPKSGRLDAERISSFFNLPLSVIARTVGRGVSTVHKTPDAEALQPGLSTFERVAAALLHLTGSPENSRMWLNARNPDLENHTPIALVKQGRGGIVADLLEDVLLGQPG
jgi:hypothetical protein